MAGKSGYAMNANLIYKWVRDLRFGPVTDASDVGVVECDFLPIDLCSRDGGMRQSQRMVSWPKSGVPCFSSKNLKREKQQPTHGGPLGSLLLFNMFNETTFKTFRVKIVV